MDQISLTVNEQLTAKQLYRSESSEVEEAIPSNVDLSEDRLFELILS